MEKERELKLGAKERSVALQQRVSLDAEAIARLCKERDELRQTAERLRLKHGTARGERDQAVQERDEARQVVSSLRADLGTTVARRLEAKNVSIGLVMELAKTWRIL